MGPILADVGTLPAGRNLHSVLRVHTWLLQSLEGWPDPEASALPALPWVGVHLVNRHSGGRGASRGPGDTVVALFPGTHVGMCLLVLSAGTWESGEGGGGKRPHLAPSLKTERRQLPPPRRQAAAFLWPRVSRAEKIAPRLCGIPGRGARAAEGRRGGVGAERWHLKYEPATAVRLQAPWTAGHSERRAHCPALALTAPGPAFSSHHGPAPDETSQG